MDGRNQSRGAEGRDERSDAMNYVRQVDFGAIDRSGATERVTQALLDHGSGAKSCPIICVKTPPGDGSSAGLHIHEVDQMFYILRGTMSIEIEGATYSCGPGSLVVFPAGAPHRNWNGGREATVHLAFNTPLPDASKPFARSL